MSALILFLYSKYYPNINILLNLVSSIDYIHTICVDNTRVRDVIMKSSLVSSKRIPCFIVIFPDKTVHQYADEQMSTFMNTLLEKQKNMQSNGKSKTPISNLVENVPDDISEIRDEDDEDEEDDEEVEIVVEKPESALPRRKPIPQAPSQQQGPSSSQPSKNKKGSKTDVGSLINFSDSQQKQNKSNNVSRSRSELMNRENIQIAKGKGHDNMLSSSLGTDIATTKKNGTGSNVIEDIGDDEETIQFTSEETSGMVKNTHKSKTDIKSIAMEMATARGETTN